MQLMARRAAIELRAHRGAQIVIEDGVIIEDGVSIEATESVSIGTRARIGAFCKIIDNHFHDLVRRFERPRATPVVVGPDAIVGPRSVVLPGASLGAGAALGPAVVLSWPLPAGHTYPERGVQR